MVIDLSNDLAAFFGMRQHVGHDVVVVVRYVVVPGAVVVTRRVVIECTTCGEVLLSFDRPGGAGRTVISQEVLHEEPRDKVGNHA